MRDKIILVLILILASAYFYNSTILNYDWEHHFLKARGECALRNNKETCEEYPPLFHWLAYPFSSSFESFLLFSVFLFCILSPLIIYWFSEKKLVSVFLYFTTISFCFHTFYFGALPASLSIVMWLVFLKTNNYYLKATLFLLAPLTHNAAFFLFTGTIFIQIAFSLFENKFLLFSFSFYVPYLDNFFDQLQRRISFLFKGCFPAFYFFALIEFWKNKKLDYLAIFLFCIVAIYFRAEAILPAQLLIVDGMSSFYSKQTKIIKLFIVAAGFVSLLVNVSVLTFHANGGVIVGFF